MVEIVMKMKKMKSLFRRWMGTTWYLSSKFVQPIVQVAQFVRGTCDAVNGLQSSCLCSQDIEARCHGYASFQKIIQHVLPENIKLQCLQMLVNDCIYPSLVSLHVTCINTRL